MRLDEDIRVDVENELSWNPDINASDVTVRVKNGVATLGGLVRSYRQRRKAEEVTKRVSGVLGV
jgi:osmotically-inducible protein OsmY